MAQTPAQTERHHELDALRAFAMLLGVVLHAALFFIPEIWGEQEYTAEGYPQESGGNVYTFLFFAIHGFRMQAFFLLSGFFTAMLWRKRGLQQLAEHRLRRIALPLAIGCLTVIPATTYAFIWSFAPEDLSLEALWWLPFIWLTTFDHLWFLWFLLWLSAGFALAVRLGVTFTNPVVWWLAIPLSAVFQVLMTEPVFGPDTSEGLLPEPVILGYYAAFFALGAHLYQRSVVMRKWWTVMLLPALTVVFLGALTLLYDVKAGWALPVSNVLQAAFAWLACFGMIGLFRWVASRERAWVRYLSDASYWIYLWHLPLIVVAYELVIAWPVSDHLKFALIVAGVTAALVVVYQYGVRYTPIGEMLNGKRVRSA